MSAWVDPRPTLQTATRRPSPSTHFSARAGLPDAYNGSLFPNGNRYAFLGRFLLISGMQDAKGRALLAEALFPPWVQSDSRSRPFFRREE